MPCWQPRTFNPVLAAIDFAASAQRRRRSQKWLNERAAATCEGIDHRAADSKDPSSFIFTAAPDQTGDHRGASEAFATAINNVRTKTTALSLESELKLADAARL
jgi:hypothetical protein